MAYDSSNVFAKILRGEIPSKKIYEDDHVLAFHDAFPKAPVHALVIPKGAYVSMNDFTATASPEEMAALFRAVGIVAQEVGLTDSGYRVISNCGMNGGQEVPHLHLHVIGGKKLGKMVEA